MSISLLYHNRDADKKNNGEYIVIVLYNIKKIHRIPEIGKGLQFARTFKTLPRVVFMLYPARSRDIRNSVGLGLKSFIGYGHTG